MAADSLDVIALISGGKDSFFSLLHCIHHGHRVVALANLFPAAAGASPTLQAIDPSTTSTTEGLEGESDHEPKEDLNSFMYQTVGHEIIALYAAATGLPLYRQPILGGTVRHERDYAFDAADKENDETESMTSLLRAIMERHPEANALNAGAILSTYQRTRVESVALRLGLTPLAYLWKYPILPPPSMPVDDAQLLKDMAAAGLEARIIKVASAGLTEDYLWERATSVPGADRVKDALRKFGTTGGAVLGEGGEFETVVLDGPPRLFRRRIAVAPEGRRAVHEGGGSMWLMLRGAILENKGQQVSEDPVRCPAIFDAKFQSIMDQPLSSSGSQPESPLPPASGSSSLLGKSPAWSRDTSGLLQWVVTADQDVDCSSIEAEIVQVVNKIRKLLSFNSLEADSISNTVIILRRMADFPKVNAEYGKLFVKPNPPSRVTISCGELLPSGSSIAIYLSVNPTRHSNIDRSGLHVQSRSYWAPANIGPYSQAVGIPVSTSEGIIGPRSWFVAGQIPLIPSSMVLPTSPETPQQMQTVLSLQHLWRIGVELKIQFWSSAVAFFARSSSRDEMRRNAVLSGQAWRLAHGSPDDEDDGNDGPDPWDLKYNPQYMSFAGNDQHEPEQSLPNWSVLTLRQQNEPDSCIPPIFAVEVEELPRQSTVEWQAHVGLSQVEGSSIEMLHHVDIGNFGWKAWQMVARGTDAIFLHTVLARDLETVGGTLGFADIEQEMSATYRASLRTLNIDDSPSSSDTAYLTYFDAVNIKTPSAGKYGKSDSGLLALVPCRSVWSPAGKPLGVIGLYRTILK